MAWVRIHDGAMTHPKVIGLSDKAFRLWIWGLSYSQQHLTDGLLPTPAIPTRLARARVDLERVGLWELHTVGAKVHDYLDWNDSREMVLKKRGEAKDRMAFARERSSQNVRTNVLDRSSPELLRRVNAGSTDLLEKEGAGKIAPGDLAARSGWLLERYPVLFHELRHGAHTRIKPVLDFQRARDLCEIWKDSAYLEKLIRVFLTADEPWISTTDRSFAVFAAKVAWCDDRLKQWEHEHQVAQS